MEDLPSGQSPPQNTDSAPFSVLAGLFEKLQAERKHDRKKKLLDSWFNRWRSEKGYDLYPVLRLILPQKDRERAVYGLKEKNLAKVYIKLIPLGMRDPDALRLLNWKKPSEKEKTSGDFPTVLLEVVSKRSSVIEGSLTVDELNNLLDDLMENIGKQELQSKVLQSIYNRSTPEEQRWIVRIILKDMNISVKEATIFSVFHPDAQDLYNTCSNLKKVAWDLWDPTFRLHPEDKVVRLFQEFAPMLCRRPTKKIEDTVREMAGHEFYIEEKLDGERMQLHKKGNEYFYCSRKGKDYTYLYGKYVENGSLTPYIDQSFDPRIDEIILDGEMLVWDPVSERNLPFGTLKTAALDRSKKELNPRPCFKVFDLLYLNGNSLLHRSTSFRKINLHSCLKEVPGRLEFVKEYKGKTVQDIRSKMEEVMDERGEGLVVKHPLSKYVLNGRNMDWIKVKPEYMDSMGETVDVLVVAGTYGTGRRGGGVSSLICAVIDDRHAVDDCETSQYSSFVRIGTGLSFADYVWVRDKPWKKWNPQSPPEFLKTAKNSHEDKGDLYLEPEDSFILKIKAAEIVLSDQYDLGLTLRFPRAMQIRDDLEISDCMTATAVLESMRSERKRKMENDAVETKKKRRVVTKTKVAMPFQYQGSSSKAIQVKSNLFNGMKFVIMSDPKSGEGENDRKELSDLIYQNGGKCVQIARNQAGLFIIYGGKTMPYDLKLLIKKDICDVLKPSWVSESVDRGELLPIRKRYIFYATKKRLQMREYHEDSSDDEAGDAEIAEISKPTPVKEIGESTHANWFNFPSSDSDKEVIAGEKDSTTDTESSEAGICINWSAEGSPDEHATLKVITAPYYDSEIVKMGQTDDAKEYDQQNIFKHLCFYLDSPDNARKNGQQVNINFLDELNESFGRISSLIQENGGQVVTLDEPKLTHVVIDKMDDSRRLDLKKRTSKPKYRHIVVSEYITACLSEQTLLNEKEFEP